MRQALLGCATLVAAAMCTCVAAVAATEELTVTADRTHALEPPKRLVGDTVTRAQIDAINVINPEDSLRYLSNVLVRKRYVGDQNGTVAVRGTNTFQSARTLVLLDGIPISNLLGNTHSYAPLWGLVAPQEIATAETMYGPFSALYSGNTMGAGIFLTTRMPTRFEADVSLLAGVQQFGQYRTDKDLASYQGHAQLGDRNGNLAWSLSADRLSSHGQPQDYAVVAVANGSATLPGTPVTGAIRETDAAGIDRFAVGAASATHDRTDLWKGRLSYDFEDGTRLTAMLGYRDLDGRLLAPESYLTDAAGNRVLTGRVTLAGRSYDLGTLTPFQRSITQLQDLLGGITLQKNFGPAVQLEASVSGYGVLAGSTRSAQPDGTAAQLNRTDDRGWWNGTARLVVRPSEALLGDRLVVGGDYAGYRTKNSVYGSPDWRAGVAGALSERNAGRTRLAGLFAEDSWSLPAGLSLTLGARFERWNAYGGRRVLAQNSVGYPRRNDDGWSPKAVLAWQAAPGWSLQAQAARAIRFPTVAELFQSRTTGGALVQSDPNLRPERSRNYAINAIHTTTLAGAAATLRLTAFDDDVRDVLYSQSNVFTNASYYQNIGRVRTRGLETMIGVQGLYDGLLDFEASAALQRSRIEENANLPASVGKEFVRVPHWRAKAQAILHPAPDWTASAGLRAEGKQYNDILNGDNRSDSYGYTSNFLFAEARVSWRLDLHTELAIGVDNLFDAKGYIFYPYPGRTATASLSWRL